VAIFQKLRPNLFSLLSNPSNTKPDAELPPKILKPITNHNPPFRYFYQTSDTRTCLKLVKGVCNTMTPEITRLSHPRLRQAPRYFGDYRPLRMTRHLPNSYTLLRRKPPYISTKTCNACSLRMRHTHRTRQPPISATTVVDSAPINLFDFRFAVPSRLDYIADPNPSDPVEFRQSAYTDPPLTPPTCRSPPLKPKSNSPSPIDLRIVQQRLY